MSFLYPLGLLGLIGIPVLILVYIIKNKYTEQTISYTYLWTLSERFLKRRNPLSRLTGIIGLVLQLLAVACLSLAIAHPIIVLPNKAMDYCFILDGSGSMNMQKDAKTRLQRGKDEIAAIIEESVNGSTYSLIYTGATTNVLCEKTEDKEKTLSLLDGLMPTHVSSDFTDALGVAQGYFHENPATKTYLVTDKTYENVSNIQLVNVAAGEDNYAIFDVEYVYENGVLEVIGKAISYETAAALTVEFYVNGETTPLQTKAVEVEKGGVATFEFTCALEKFLSFTTRMQNADALQEDNECIVFNIENENAYKTLLVSDTPFFIQSAIESVSTAEVTVLPTAKYTGQSGYGLYIFDSYNPAQLPKDGAVWFFNLTESVAETGFSVQTEVVLEQADTLTYTNSSSSTAKKLMENILAEEEIYIAKYMKYGVYRNFTTLLSYKGNPVVFTGENAYGNREVVFAFDLHDTNFPLLMNFGILTDNLLTYSFPEVVEKVSYSGGEKLQINVLSGCENVKIDTPLGNTYYVTTDAEADEFTLDEAGTYAITMTIAGNERRYNVYVAFPEVERAPATFEPQIALQGEATANGRDGKYDDLVFLFIGLTVIFLADWVVYCYDKYQLR